MGRDRLVPAADQLPGETPADLTGQELAAA